MRKSATCKTSFLAVHIYGGHMHKQSLCIQSLCMKVFHVFYLACSQVPMVASFIQLTEMSQMEWSFLQFFIQVTTLDLLTTNKSPRPGIMPHHNIPVYSLDPKTKIPHLGGGATFLQYIISRRQESSLFPVYEWTYNK